MRNERTSIWKIVRSLNDSESNGGLWLPNIQRPFVWSEEQIEKLFDSVMREYPISTLLVWRTRLSIKHRKFIDQWKDTLKVSDAYVMQSTEPKGMVLDGQQRLQSLIIALRGSYNGRELHFDVTSGQATLPEDTKYKFRFMPYSTAPWPWVRLKDILNELHKGKKLPMDVANEICAKSPLALQPEQATQIHRNLARAHQEFINDDNVSYQLLDSVDDPDAYTIDDVVEIFIRANAGGTKLGKSDLLFSLLASDWELADEQMEELLDELNKTGYAFDRDFVLKSCLVMLDHGAKYEVAKFRDPLVRGQFVDRWDLLSDAMKAVRDFVFGKTFLKSDKAVPSYLGLIPIIYFRYKYPEKWDAAEGVQDYILRTMLTGAFSGTPDNLIDRCVKAINESERFGVDDLFKIIRADGRSLEVTPDTILETKYGKPLSHLIFNIWYRDFDYEPALEDSLPQQDHLFPQSLLKKQKEINPETQRDRRRFSSHDRDQIANLALLTARENGFQGKSDTPLSDWLPAQIAKDPEFLNRHLIPADPNLWRIENFSRFVTERRALILQKFERFLQYDRSTERLGQTPENQ